MIFRDVPTSRFTAAPSTGWEIPKEHGIDLAPRRGGPTWAVFLRSQTEAIIACDFFTVDPLDGTTAYVMAMIEYTTRRIHILATSPTHAHVGYPAGQKPPHGPPRERQSDQVPYPRPATSSTRLHSMRSWPTPVSGPCAAPYERRA